MMLIMLIPAHNFWLYLIAGFLLLVLLVVDIFMYRFMVANVLIPRERMAWKRKWIIQDCLLVFLFLIALGIFVLRAHHQVLF